MLLVFFFLPETVTSARSPGTGAFVPRNPPSRARDVTHAPLRSAAERATGQTRAHRRISKGGCGGVGVQKQNSRSKLCASAPGLPDVPKYSVGNRRRWFRLTGASRRRLSPPRPPLRSFLPLRGVSNLWREQRKAFFTESRDSSAVEFEKRVACLFMALLKWIKKRENSY